MSVDAYLGMILNRVRVECERVLSRLAKPRHGFVVNYDPNRYAVRVAIQPEGTPTGYIPLKSDWVGNGWGDVAGPSIGDTVELSFQEGVLEAAVVSGRFFNAKNPPPPVPSGERWIIHKTGSLLKFHNDGSVEVTAAGNMTLTAGATLRLAAPTIQLHAINEYRWDVDGHGQAWLPTKVDTYQIGESPGTANPISPPEIGD